MNWTKERPDKPGWYWFREAIDACPIRVELWSDCLLVVKFFGGGLLPLTQLTWGEWGDPIPEPGEVEP